MSRLVGVKAKGDGPLDLWPGRTRAWLALRIRIAPSVGAPGRGARLHVGRPGRLDGRPSKFVREPEFAAVFQQTASHRASHTPAPAGRARGPVRPTGGQHRCHKCGFRRCIGRAGARGDGAMARAQLGMQQGLPASLDRQKHPPAVGSPAHSDARFDGCPLSARPAPTPKFPATLGDNMLAGSYTERLGERGPRRALALDKCNVPSSRGPAAFARKDRVRAEHRRWPISECQRGVGLGCGITVDGAAHRAWVRECVPSLRCAWTITGLETAGRRGRAGHWLSAATPLACVSAPARSRRQAEGVGERALTWKGVDLGSVALQVCVGCNSS